MYEHTTAYLFILLVKDIGLFFFPPLFWAVTQSILANTLLVWAHTEDQNFWDIG